MPVFEMFALTWLLQSTPDAVLDRWGYALGGTIIVVSFLAGAVAFLYRKLDNIYALRLAEQEKQYEARLKDQATSYEARLGDMRTLAQFQQTFMRRGVEVQDVTIRELGSRLG